MALVHSIFCSCALLLFSSVLLCLSLHVHGEETVTYRAVRLPSLLPSDVCSSPKGVHGSKPATLDIVHRHGPCSPFPRNREPDHLKILDQDQARVQLIQHSISTASKRDAIVGSLVASLPAHTGSSFSTGNYIVKLGFGTPKKDFSVIFDTGSDLTWIQCKPCSKCYNQSEPMFDPSQSLTYHNFSCSSDECQQLDDYACSSASVCQYSVKYGDRSKSKGAYVQDTLTLTPSDVLPHFKFGCAQEQTGDFGTVAGLLGLGRASESLISQAAAKYGKVFSYCLPSRSSFTGYLTIGGRTTSNLKFTPMLTNLGSLTKLGSFYAVKLVAISVGGKKLAIPPTDFSNPGTVLDSGTVITRLPPSAYSILRSTFREMMPRTYPMAPPLSILDTCYDFPGIKEVKVPAVELQFDGGASLDVDFSGLLYVEAVNGSSNRGCLPFATNDKADGVIIVGNVQQQTYNVVYDLANQRIGFGKKGCK